MTIESAKIARRGLLLILSSPSGAGKTTLARGLLEREPRLTLSISLTTRAPRPGERDGVDYHFVSEAEFFARRANGDLLEWAEVFGHDYGTLRAPVLDALEHGTDMLFDIDWQGTQQIAERLPGDLVRVFLLPPSRATLEERLKLRQQDSDDVVRRRMAEAADEMSHWAEYDYVIVNADLEATLATLRAILAAERARRDRLIGLSAFVRDLQRTS